ncbi:MAG: DUF3152 domain-containing protein [bacterium]|nr:DUF3152 domain-containing protein [bacterium]
MRFRASALGGFLFLAAVLSGPATPSAATSVTGFPRCDLVGDTVDYTWWADGENVAITEEPQLEWDGDIVDATEVDCLKAVACLGEWPERSGQAATIVGTGAGEVLVGTDGPDLIVGRGGADVLDGRRGQDTLCGGSGDDVLLGGRGSDRLFGRSGRDELRGGASPDVLDGGTGSDAVFGGVGDDLLRGRSGRDAIYTDAGIDIARGGNGRDVCFGEDADDTFRSCGVAAVDGIEYGSGSLRTFRVQVDSLLDESPTLFAADVDWILSDERSWIGAENVTWRRVASDESADLTIILAAPATVDAICHPLKTGGYFSCRNGDTIGININRWNTATDWWPASLQVYRTYVINHEVGHFLGNGHVSCPGPGELARVMQQQTKTLGGCIANGWVFPEGAQ